MVTENIFVRRDESITNLWFFIIINTTILALLINILSLHYGYNGVAPTLFYIPVVIAAYWYPHRGPVFAVIISLAYLGLVYFFLGYNPAVLIASSVICYVLIGVSVVVSSLATHMRRNEVKYRGLFNNTQAGVGLIERSSLKITEVNHHLTTILGYTNEELLRTPFADLFPDAGKRDEFFKNLDNTGGIENFETRLRTRNDGNKWVSPLGGRLPDDYFVVNIVDITDRKHAELALLIRDHAISSSINAIAILDLDFNITYVNESLLHLMGYHDQKELIGRNATGFVSSPQRYATLQETIRRNASWFGEIALLKNDKAPFYALLWMNKVQDDSGNPICIMVSFIDITDRKQMEIAKRRALQQIEKNIEQFAVLGDHIRNPLAVIIGLSSMAPTDITEKIVVQAREIDRIVTQLDMGWIESEKVRDFIKKYYMVGAQDAFLLGDDVQDDDMPREYGKA